MKSNIQETCLYDPILAKYNLANDIYLEVAFYRKRVDVVFLENNKITAVELKVSDWKKAIKQASINQLFADYSFVGMPYSFKSLLNIEVRKFFTNRGVGLILIGKNIETVIEAKHSSHLYPNDRKRVKQTLANYSLENEIEPWELFDDQFRQQHRPPAFLPAGAYKRSGYFKRLQRDI